MKLCFCLLYTFQPVVKYKSQPRMDRVTSRKDTWRMTYNELYFVHSSTPEWERATLYIVKSHRNILSHKRHYNIQDSSNKRKTGLQSRFQTHITCHTTLSQSTCSLQICLDILLSYLSIFVLRYRAHKGECMNNE